MRIYICGPMTGIPEMNYPMFNNKAAELRAEGHTVINPAENVNESGSWDGFMRLSIKQLLEVDTVYLLPWWQNSRGARLEVVIAAALGLNFWDQYVDLTIGTKNIVRKALICSLYHNETS